MRVLGGEVAPSARRYQATLTRTRVACHLTPLWVCESQSVSAGSPPQGTRSTIRTMRTGSVPGTVLICPRSVTRAHSVDSAAPALLGTKASTPLAPQEIRIGLSGGRATRSIMDATSGAGPAQSVSDQPSIDSGGPDAMEVESAVTSVAPLAAAPATTAATTGDAMSVDPPVSKSAPDSTSPAVDSADATATTAETMTVTPTAATSEAAALPVSAPDTEPPPGPGAPNAAPAVTPAATGSKPVPDASFNKPKADASYKPKADASYTPASVSVGDHRMFAPHRTIRLEERGLTVALLHSTVRRSNPRVENPKTSGK